MKLLDRFGRATTGFFEYAGGLTLLSAESIGFMARLRIRTAETISQCALLGVQSLPYLASLATALISALPPRADEALRPLLQREVPSAISSASTRDGSAV